VVEAMDWRLAGIKAGATFKQGKGLTPEGVSTGARGTLKSGDGENVILNA